MTNQSILDIDNNNEALLLAQQINIIRWARLSKMLLFSNQTPILKTTRRASIAHNTLSQQLPEAKSLPLLLEKKEAAAEDSALERPPAGVCDGDWSCQHSGQLSSSARVCLLE
jgi:hypothetical protein